MREPLREGDTKMEKSSPVVDMSWVERRMERIERNMRMLLELLIANKTIDEKTAKYSKKPSHLTKKS
jgi:hypothetical protein